jgi:hypothetical protein
METDDGGQLELITDDVRMASGDTPQAARASSCLSAAAGFANEEPGTGEQGGQEETDESLARLLRARYGEQRSDPEVVGSLNDRKQMRGEPLVE